MDNLKRYISYIHAPVLFLAASIAHAGSETAINLDASIGIDDNVTRAQQNADIENDTFVTVFGSLVHEAVELESGAIVLNGDLSITEFSDFSGLSNWSAGGGVNYTFSTGTGFGAPWLALDLQYKIVEFDSFLRDSDILVGTFTYGQVIDDRTALRTALIYQQRESDGVAFDTENLSWFLNFDFKIQPKMTLYTTYKFQDGDIFSSADQNNVGLDIINASTVDGVVQIDQEDDAFIGKSAYRVDGEIQFITVGLNIARNLHSAYDISARFLTSESDEGGLEYEDLTLRVSYFQRFDIELF